MTRRSALALLLLSASVAGCASAGRPAVDVRWPLPPEKARIQFIRSFTREADLPAPLGRRIARIFIPASPDAVVAGPTGLALSNDEKTLYVACAAAARVLAVNLESGEIRLAANIEGRRPNNPTDVALDANDNLYVSDSKTDSIWVYGPGGEFLRRIAGEKIDFPTMLAIDRKAQVLYVVAGVRQKSGAHRIEALSLKGDPIRTIGKRGPNQGEFNFPAHIAVGADSRLYVVDMLNFRVQVFDPEGRPAGAFGTIGSNQPGSFDKAKGVALDTFGNIYVTDSAVGWVQMFNPRFQVLMAFGGRAQLPGYLTLPTAIAIGSKNQIFVADFGAGRVNEYQLVNTTAADSFIAEPDITPTKAAPASTPALSPSPVP